MMDHAMAPCLAAALEYAVRGWHVFPAKIEGRAKKGYVSGKKAGGPRWGATDDPALLRSYWARYQGALVGLPTGPAGGFFVVECDTVKGHDVDGIGTMTELLAQHGALPETIEALSPSGSWHIYFRWPVGADIRNSEGRIGLGIDVRGEGGMVIAPPSTRVGFEKPYRWKNPPGQFDLADCPDWLLDLVLSASTKRTTGGAKPKGDATTDPFMDFNGADRQGTTAAEVAELLSHIDPDAGGYSVWIEILQALHDHFTGTPQGLDLAIAWSQRGMLFEVGEVEAKWAGFTVGGGLTLSTIAKRAQEAGADLSEIARRHKGGGPRKPDAAAGEASDDDAPDLSHDHLALDLGHRDWDANARHVALWGKWLFWDGVRWRRDEKLKHLTKGRDYLRMRARALVAWAERQISEGQISGNPDKFLAAIKEQAKSLRSRPTVVAVTDLARTNARSSASHKDFDGDPLLLGTPGGTVDLRTGQLREARRGDMISLLTACRPAPSSIRPTLWLRFLDDIFEGDRATIAFLQRAAGYALTGSTSEHKLLFLHGSGRNGKSVFLNTLLDIWGDYGRRVPAATFLNSQSERHPTDIAGLEGARLAIASELPRGKTWDEATIKDLTGGDRMSARFMRQDFFEFDPQLTLMIAGNTQPSFRGVDEAIRARVVLVPFTVTIPPEKRDKKLPEKLRAEAYAILRWAIDGALAWQERGLDVPASIQAASMAYFDEEDVIGQFLDEETLAEAGAFLSSDDLIQCFNFWSERQGLGTWTKRTLVKELKLRGFEDAKSNSRRGVRGLRLKR